MKQEVRQPEIMAAETRERHPKNRMTRRVEIKEVQEAYLTTRAAR